MHCTASGSPRKSSQTGKNPWSLAAQIKQRNVSVIRGNRKKASSLQGVESKRDFMDFLLVIFTLLLLKILFVNFSGMLGLHQSQHLCCHPECEGPLEHESA